MFYVCLVYGNSGISGLCVVMWGVVGGGLNMPHNHTQPAYTRITINQTNIEHIDPHR